MQPHRIPATGQAVIAWQEIAKAGNSIAFQNMIEYRMAKPFMCLLMLEAIEAIVKAKRKNDC